jgi:putative transposase
MSSVGCCYDNALVESFFATLKVECGSRFPSRAAAQLAVFDYLEGYYNRCRPHSALGYLSPMAFEQAWVSRQRIEEP